MRTTLDIEEDVLSAVKELARLERKRAGQVLSEFARQGLEMSLGANGSSEAEEFLGFHPLPARGVVVTSELLPRLCEGDPSSRRPTSTT